MKRITALVLIIALGGCADKIMSDAHIRDSTAIALNQPPAAVRISDRRYDGMMTTYYTAYTPSGSYRCTINGGNITAFGMTDPPECSPLGSPAPAPHRQVGQRASN